MQGSGVARSKMAAAMVGRLFWDFDGKEIALPMIRENYPKEGFVEWHRKEGCLGRVSAKAGLEFHTQQTDINIV